MRRHEIVAIGASAGGVEAIIRLVRDLPRDLPAAVFVVIHKPRDHESLLRRILSHHGPLTAKYPPQDDAIQLGTIYVAPSNRTMTLAQGFVGLNGEPAVHFVRPVVDPLFRSAAKVYGPEVVGIILSGGGRDGAKGLAAIRAAGGITVVQDPEDAKYPGLPRNAICEDSPDYCLHLNEIAPLIVELAHGRKAR